MIRFYEKRNYEKKQKIFNILSKSVRLTDDIWIYGKELFKQNLSHDTAAIQMLPIVNEVHEIICYAYQDSEANRELRMLKELETHKNALQFQDIFPDVKEVVLHGCNELAYCFVKYLEKQQINVSVTGKYWKYLGYENDADVDLDDEEKMIICAENTKLNYGTSEYPTIKSASPEFECIDTIYEANVREGKIKDITGNFAEILEKLREKRVVMLGTDATAQDAYDLLYQNGIDIYSFAEWKSPHTTLLGKKIINVSEALCGQEKFAFINCHDKNSALGEEEEDFFDYYGYTRNKEYFLIQDYTNIPHSNLIHILKGRTVWLAGEEKLCLILRAYLRDVEQGDIDVQYVKLSACASMGESEILCTVYPWYNSRPLVDNSKFWYFNEQLSSMKNLSYTDYFSCTRAFVIIELCRNRDHERFSVKQLIPKGIFLGKIPALSGNSFLRGILDGHPSILKGGYNNVNNNLFCFCICLANEKSQDILKVFGDMLQIEYLSQLGVDTAMWDEFKKQVEPLLLLKEQFTSQELFVIFHIAYAEMVTGKKITDLSDMVIYWEPHHVPRSEFLYLAQWLEDEKINGQTIYMHRDFIVWTGSCYKSYMYKKNSGSLGIIYNITGADVEEDSEDFCQYWTEFDVRFEDIKLHPYIELKKMCDRLAIPWSDSMLKTTNEGEVYDYQGVIDFDIKPVFNKYEEYLSAFDRFRLAIISSPYQKLYGYTHESCMKFTRMELQDMFLRKFRFQENLQFRCKKDEISYYLRAYELMRQKLWKVRRHEVLNDIIPRLGQMDIGQSVMKEESEKRKVHKGYRAKMAVSEDIYKLVEYVKQQDKLILYGIGRDCEALLEYMDVSKPGIVFCDAAAAYQEVVFHGNSVIAPDELSKYCDDYQILITSSRHYRSIYKQLVELGISPERIVCNMLQLWQEENS